MVNVMGKANKRLKEYSAAVAQEVLKYIGESAELTIKFVSAHEIKKLNCIFRNIDKVTDVLSFPATNTKAGDKVDPQEEYLGDMAICLKQTKKQAKEYGNTLEAEVKKLIIHSILHLVGYDHILDQDYKIMSEKEEEIASKIKL